MKNFMLGLAGVGLCGVGAAAFFLGLGYWGWWLVAGLAVLASTYDH